MDEASGNPLDAPFFSRSEHLPLQAPAAAQPSFGHWLTVEQIRKMQRMRRQTVIAAMESGALPYERRGRIRYARLSDVLLWEERRLSHTCSVSTRPIAAELMDLV